MFNRRGFLKALFAAPAALVLGGVRLRHQPPKSKGVSGSLNHQPSETRTPPAFTFTNNVTSGTVVSSTYTVRANYISQGWVVPLVRVWDNDEDSVYDA